MTSETRNCQNCKQDFQIDPEDFNFYKKMEVPPPTFCPLCRAQRRMAFRNERKLFKVKDYFSGEIMFSLYPEEGGSKSATQEKWFGDQWDALDYAQEIDWSRPFLNQVIELRHKVPAQSLRVEYMIDSPYSANASSLKNCYLLFNSSYSEDCMYGNAVDKSKDCVDNSHINESERCYDCFWIRKCYQCYFTIMSWDSRNLWFSRDCGGCSNCFGCVNLRGKSYCIFNKQYTKEEYEQKIKEMKLDTQAGLEDARRQARAFWAKHIRRNQQGIRNYDSSGSYVTDSKNVNDSFLIREGENLRYCQYLQVPSAKDCYDATAWGDGMEMHYETCLSGDNSYNLKFCDNSWPNCKNLEYCINLVSSSDCFGCVGLKKKQYCILNKQYTKEEYEELVSKIKKHMADTPYVNSQGIIYKYGEFFPTETTPFGFNNTTAFQYFDMTKSEAEQKGYPWIDVPRGEYDITVSADQLPGSAGEISETILKEVVECSVCKYPYKILENELVFYRKENLPPPRACQECRFRKRIQDRLKLELYERHCSCSGTEGGNGQYKNTVAHQHGNEPCPEIFKTGYAPDRPEIVYCEKCYQAEVY